MRSVSLRSGNPGVRFRRALAFSLLLHAVVLTPWHLPVRQSPAKPPDTPALSATLMAPVLKTFEEPSPPEQKSRPAAPPPKPAAAAAVNSAPRPLTGRALDTAMAAIVKEAFYPRVAIERGLEGRVVLLLTLAENGAVTGIEVASSSGHLLLDQAAITAAGRIGQLPGGRRQVLLPVDFRLE